MVDNIDKKLLFELNLNCRQTKEEINKMETYENKTLTEKKLNNIKWETHRAAEDLKSSLLCLTVGSVIAYGSFKLAVHCNDKLDNYGAKFRAYQKSPEMSKTRGMEKLQWYVQRGKSDMNETPPSVGVIGWGGSMGTNASPGEAKRNLEHAVEIIHKRDLGDKFEEKALSQINTAYKNIDSCITSKKPEDIKYAQGDLEVLSRTVNKQYDVANKACLKKRPKLKVSETFYNIGLFLGAGAGIISAAIAVLGAYSGKESYRNLKEL